MIDDRFIITESDFALLYDLASHEHLADELDNAEVVDSRRIPPDVVTMNSRLLFKDQTTGETREVTIVFPQDADAPNGKVSVLAPVGTALLGLAENQSIVWPFPDGSKRCLRVLEVIYQPESDGELLREARSADNGSIMGTGANMRSKVP
ncbi:MAG: nucleoside diphosphate kinase regulator [Casimicrobiaceae bacterium]